MAAARPTTPIAQVMTHPPLEPPTLGRGQMRSYLNDPRPLTWDDVHSDDEPASAHTDIDMPDADAMDIVIA